MASRSYGATVIVLRKTKLGESDLILSLLAEDGRQIRAVAKGARKPTSGFASRLELFSLSDLLLASGRSLDLVKEAHLRVPHDALRQDFDKTMAASIVAELLLKSTHEGLAHPRLFPMTAAYLNELGEIDDEDSILLLSIAAFLKAVAIQGFRPHLDSCVECGGSLDEATDGSERFFSAEAGGVLCEDCRHVYRSTSYAYPVLSWVAALVQMRFSEIARFHADSATIQDLLTFCHNWVDVHLGIRLRTLKLLERM